MFDIDAHTARLAGHFRLTCTAEHRRRVDVSERRARADDKADREALGVEEPRAPLPLERTYERVENAPVLELNTRAGRRLQIIAGKLKAEDPKLSETEAFEHV